MIGDLIETSIVISFPSLILDLNVEYVVFITNVYLPLSFTSILYLLEFVNSCNSKSPALSFIYIL